jgi:DNA polymerase/3'-5' exonuclease PolX
MYLVGSYRRCKKYSGDIDCIITKNILKAKVKEMIKLDYIKDVYS